MEQDYTYVMNIILNQFEGGYGWDRNDPGGPTKWGITCYDLAEYLHQTMNSMAQWASKVEAMAIGTADIIYATKYKPAVNFDALHPGVDFTLLDMDINSGNESIKIAQRIVGVAVDGDLGPITLAAIGRQLPDNFITEHCAQRLEFLRGLSTWPDFGDGWTTRVNTVKSKSLFLAQNGGPPSSLSFEAMKDVWNSVSKAIMPPKHSAKGWPEVPSVLTVQ